MGDKKVKDAYTEAEKKKRKKIADVSMRGTKAQVNYTDGTGYYIGDTTRKTSDKHIKKAFGGSKVASIQRSNAGVQVNYKDGTGYWMEYKKKKKNSATKKAYTAAAKKKKKDKVLPSWQEYLDGMLTWDD